MKQRTSTQSYINSRMRIKSYELIWKIQRTFGTYFFCRDVAIQPTTTIKKAITIRTMDSNCGLRPQLCRNIADGSLYNCIALQLQRDFQSRVRPHQELHQTISTIFVQIFSQKFKI
ncbi:unnamed protein product [Trifolium pratense]|uniref:Uncharacterized protein n=1 Tax=Trifolium pratense TaxID=57577 RepID=A0ACB0L4Q1_TRIPR|nr:unnamed protein product [Trifolium pratense]